MDQASTDVSSEPSWHWFAYVSPVTSIMALTMFLASDPTSSMVYSVISIVTGLIGLVFCGKAPKPVWPILSSVAGILFSCYIAGGVQGYWQLIKTAAAAH